MELVRLPLRFGSLSLTTSLRILSKFLVCVTRCIHNRHIRPKEFIVDYVPLYGGVSFTYWIRFVCVYPIPFSIILQYQWFLPTAGLTRRKLGLEVMFIMFLERPILIRKLSVVALGIYLFTIFYSRMSLRFKPGLVFPTD
jgi:hypothetical protein